ncbi:MAG TPA: PQQ-binding-like beta-propeller repeat protein, partial [Planctomycetota bacterium]|nr:PQQ-binding-like beta-propeller repeat protein [Planctomycetota bacterium]
EVWNFSYYVFIKNYHGISRTVPAVNDDFVVTLGPHCHVTCLRTTTGERVWKMDLVRDFGTVVPEWYAGQCPLIEGENVILAPGGETLMLAVRLSDGEIVWRTPNPVPPSEATPDNPVWAMTHSSIMPMVHAGVRQYVYNTTRGVVGVRASDGVLLWKTETWRVDTANVASPVVVDADRIFFAGGYKSGAVMLRLIDEGDAITVEEVFRIPDDRVFSAAQQTPILYEGYLYGVIQRGELVCLDLDGRVRWTSGTSRRFGLGPYLAADGMLLVLNDEKGTLHRVEATPEAYRELAHAKVLSGAHAWAPLALADGKLLLRDDTHMKCLRVGTREK